MELRAEVKQKVPPYLPLSVFTKFIAELNENGIPTHIDRSVLRKKSGTTQSWLINTLIFFEFIELDGKVTDKLNEIVESDDLGSALMKTVRRAYRGLFRDVDTNNGTQQQLTAWFRNFDVAQSTAIKCSNFFLDVCKLTNIPLSNHFGKRTPPRPTIGKSRRRISESSNVDGHEQVSDVRDNQPDLPILEESLILGLIQRLPGADDRFSKSERELWFTLAEGIFDMVYGSGTTSTEDGDNDVITDPIL